MLGKSPLDLALLICTKPWGYTLKIIINVNKKQMYYKVKIMKIPLKMFARIFLYQGSKRGKKGRFS